MRTILALAAARVAAACTGCTPMTVCDYIAAPVLFAGEAIDGGVERFEEPRTQGAAVVRFRVLEAFRGLEPGAETFTLELQTGPCSPNPYWRGRRYLVAPSPPGGRRSPKLCTSGADIVRHPHLIALVRHHFGMPAQPAKVGAARVSGQPIGVTGYAAIAQMDYFSSLPGMTRILIDAGEAKPATGATVQASAGSDTFTARVDQDGRFRIPVTSPGFHLLALQVDGYPAVNRKVHVNTGGCATSDLSVRAEGTATGKLLDSSGRAVPHGRVALIDLEAPHTTTRRDPWLLHTETDDFGRFFFRNAPIGRFLVAHNPHGPSETAPFETTYYPGAASRANAKAVVVDSASALVSGLNIQVGKPVSFRDVTVSAKLPDGTLWHNASFQMRGQPVEDGELPWRVLQKDVDSSAGRGTATFRAPANRRLRIAVRHLLGHPQDAEYAAEFAPGPTPIVHVFNVEP